MDVGGDKGDGRIRKGTVWTATAHAITAIIGSGILALPWSVAQLGWIVGVLVLVGFAYVTYYTAILLSDCYRYPDPVDGKRNHTYMDAVRAFFGRRSVFICGALQYGLLWGTMIGYTIVAATSMMAMKRTNCIHEKGHTARCGATGTSFMIIFGAMEIVLSQFPNLEKLSLMSVIAAAMSFTYSLIALCLCTAKLATHHKLRGSLFGAKIGSMGISPSTKVWHAFQALGNIAFAYTYAMLLIEIQDTLRSPPPENKTMKKATMWGVGVTTVFYISLGCVGYAAFGNNAPGNVLTGFSEPFWLVDIAHLAVIVHLVGAYQVFAQPIFALHEKWLASRWPTTSFFNTIYSIRVPFTREACFEFTLSKLVLRTVFVIFTTVVAMMLPFFNAIVGLLGAVAFWPLTIYFPVSMYVAQAEIKRGSRKWVMLQSLSIFSLIVSLAAAMGSVADIASRLKHAQFFKLSL